MAIFSSLRRKPAVSVDEREAEIRRQGPTQFRGEVERVLKQLEIEAEEIEYFDARPEQDGRPVYYADVTTSDGASFRLLSALNEQGYFMKTAVLVGSLKAGAFERTYAGDVVLPSLDELNSKLADFLRRQLDRPKISPTGTTSTPQLPAAPDQLDLARD